MASDGAARPALDAGRTCPDCGGEMETADCDECGGEGSTPPGLLHDVDPLWYAENDTDPCDLCGGSGVWWYCPECVARARREDYLHNLAMAAVREGEGR